MNFGEQEEEVAEDEEVEDTLTVEEEAHQEMKISKINLRETRVGAA